MAFVGRGGRERLAAAEVLAAHLGRMLVWNQCFLYPFIPDVCITVQGRQGDNLPSLCWYLGVVTVQL